MYLYKTVNKEEFQDLKFGPPFGPGLTQEVLDTLTHVEVWATNFSDRGPDYTEFRGFNGEKLVSTSRIDGY